MDITLLRTDARYHVSPQLTSTDYPDAALDRNLNRWYRMIFAWAVKAQGDWELNGDILTRDLSTGVTDYEKPSTLVSIYKGEIMYTTGGKYVPLNPIDVQRRQNFSEGNSTRVFDDVTLPTMEVFGEIIQIKPAPTEDVVNGLMIWAQLDFVDLASSTNEVPDVMEAVQRILSYGAAYDYCLSKEMWSKATEIKRMIYGDTRLPDDKGLKGVVDDLYSMQNNSSRDRVVTRRRSYR